MKCPTIVLSESDQCCKPLIRAIDCFFNPVTKEVKDKHNNLIGYGKIKDGFLIVTRKIITIL